MRIGFIPVAKIKNAKDQIRVSLFVSIRCRPFHAQKASMMFVVVGHVSRKVVEVAVVVAVVVWMVRLIAVFGVAHNLLERSLC